MLKRLGATPLSRRGLIAAKTVTVAVVELGQAVVIVAVGVALGWRPHAGGAALPWTVLLILAGTAAFSGLALLMAGTLRAEATLAAANLVYLVMLGIGGMVFPLTKFPAAVQPALRLLPPGALSDGCARCCSTAPACRWPTWRRSPSGQLPEPPWRCGPSVGSSAVTAPPRRRLDLALASCRRRPWC